MAQRGEVTIFTISTNRTGLALRGDKVLKYLAEETGGPRLLPLCGRRSRRRFSGNLRELRSQYSLAYVSTNTTHDGTFRTITIQSKEKGVHVRAKSGYFAPSQ